MCKHITVVLGLIVLVTHCAFATEKAELEKRVQNYVKAGKEVVEMAVAKKLDIAVAEKDLKACVEEAKWFCAEYAKAFPKGEKLLKTVVDNEPAMEKLAFKELESEWHDGGYFTKHDVGVNLKEEENEHFTDPIHSLVHPLLVLRAAHDYGTSKSDEDLKKIKEEMEEGIEQAEKLKAALEKK